MTPVGTGNGKTRTSMFGWEWAADDAKCIKRLEPAGKVDGPVGAYTIVAMAG
jgi:hypothetical protein